MKVNRLPKRVREEEMMHVIHNIARNIRLARMDTGLSQREMGEMLGFRSATALSLIEDGQRKLSASLLWKIATITDYPVQHFFLKGLIPNND